METSILLTTSNQVDNSDEDHDIGTPIVSTFLSAVLWTATKEIEDNEGDQDQAMWLGWFADMYFPNKEDYLPDIEPLMAQTSSLNNARRRISQAFIKYAIELEKTGNTIKATELRHYAAELTSKLVYPENHQYGL